MLFVVVVRLSLLALHRHHRVGVHHVPHVQKLLHRLEVPHLHDLRMHSLLLFSSRRRHTIFDCDWSSDVCSSDLLSIIEPIMNAVSYLHNQKLPIIHRDIKPSNIIVPPSRNEAVLVDFGIAKEFDPDSTTTAVRHASPGYAAPEQYGVGTNTRTDIYGLGATMYTLLTGVVPADAFFRTTNLGSGKNDPLESIRKFAPNVPQHITDAIYRAMAVD